MKDKILRDLYYGEFVHWIILNLLLQTYDRIITHTSAEEAGTAIAVTTAMAGFF